MLDTSSSQYDSFLYWRQPIPALDLSEIEDLGLSGCKSVKGTKTGKKPKIAPKPRELKREAEADLSEYNTFNYWRDPIASIDALDFNLLL